jgi:hypothetical protein
MKFEIDSRSIKKINKETWKEQNKSIYDYPSYKLLIEKFAKRILRLMKQALPQPPGYFVQMEVRNKKS